jgi:hypothetical protein
VSDSGGVQAAVAGGQDAANSNSNGSKMTKDSILALFNQVPVSQISL